MKCETCSGYIDTLRGIIADYQDVIAEYKSLHEELLNKYKEANATIERLKEIIKQRGGDERI